MRDRSLAAVTRAGLLLLAWLGCATTGPAIIRSDEPCTTAAECAVTNFGGCCGCHSEPWVTNRAHLELNEKGCATANCICPGGCGKDCPRSLLSRRSGLPCCNANPTRAAGLNHRVLNTRPCQPEM